MPINIPPSPSAEEVPDYAQRLREVRELTQSKKPARRRRRAHQSQAGAHQKNRQEIPSGNPCAQEKPSAQTVRFTTDEYAPEFEQKQERSPQAAATAIHRHVEKIDVSRLVRFPRRKETQVKQTNTESLAASRVIAASAIVSAAVSLVMTFATQGVLSPVASGLLASSGPLSSMILGA